ncbi:hypothetical protein GQQ23_12685 [Pantoea agglomerans]|nr:hypothetical protein [Pantoea agglomerans]
MFVRCVSCHTVTTA